MRTLAFITTTLLALGMFAPWATSAPDGWHTSLKDGIAAAEKSRRPIFLITAWKRTL